jgi:hypothetical protein
VSITLASGRLVFKATIFRGAADGCGSSELALRRWCLQTEIQRRRFDVAGAKDHVGLANEMKFCQPRQQRVKPEFDNKQLFLIINKLCQTQK